MEPVMPSSSVRHRMVWFRWDNNMARWSPSCRRRLHRQHRFHGVIGLYGGAWLDEGVVAVGVVVAKLSDNDGAFSAVKTYKLNSRGGGWWNAVVLGRI